MATGPLQGTRRIIAGMAGAQAAAADLARARAGDELDEDIDPEELAAAEPVFGAAEKYFKARRMYEEGYPGLERFQESFQERLTSFLDQYDDLEVQVMPTGLFMYGQPVHVLERVEQNMWFPIYRDGIRELVFSPGIDTQEVHAFFSVLTSLSARPGAEEVSEEDEEDDAVTMLWDLDLEHVGYTAIDSFAEGADHGGAEGTQQRMSKMRDMVTVSMMKDLSRTTHAAANGEVVKKMKTVSLSRADLHFLESENLAALDELPATTTEARGDLYALEPWELVLLNEGMTDSSNQVEKFLEAVIRALLGGGAKPESEVLVQRLSQFFEAMIVDGKFARAERWRRHVAELLGGSSGAEVDYDLLAQVDRAMSTERSVVALLKARAGTTDPAICLQIAGLLAVLPAYAAGPLLTHFGLIDDYKVRRKLLEPLARWGQTALDAATAALATSPEEVALDILHLVRLIGSDSALAVLDEASRHPNGRVRAEAVRYYAEAAPPPLAAKRARSALHDTDPLVRRAGLEHVISARPEEGVHWLKESIGAERFAKLELSEKRRLFIAYASLGGAAVLGELAERLSQRNLWGKGELNDERVAAAAGLGQLRTPEARAALEKVAKSKLTRSAVKQACAEAIALIDRPAPSTSLPAGWATQPVQTFEDFEALERVRAAQERAVAQEHAARQQAQRAPEAQQQALRQQAHDAAADQHGSQLHAAQQQAAAAQQREAQLRAAQAAAARQQREAQLRAARQPQPRTAPTAPTAPTDADRPAGTYRTPAARLRRHPALGGGNSGDGEGGEGGGGNR